MGLFLIRGVRRQESAYVRDREDGNSMPHHAPRKSLSAGRLALA